MANEPTPAPAVNDPAPAVNNPAPAAPVTFSTEQMAEANRIADERAQRAAASALKAYFQQQGMSEAEAKAALEAYRAQKAAQKTPEQLADEATRTANTRVSAAKQTVLQLSARAAAAALGVKPERLDYALKLADLSSIEVGDDMKVDGEAVKAAIQKVVDNLPELAGAAASTPAANPASETKPVYTPEKLAGMSMEEYRAYRQKNGFPKN